MINNNHDSHYRTMDIEPYDVMQQRVRPHPGTDHCGPTQQQKLAMAIALKHIMRAGLKDGQLWEKDIEKAMNYLHRALTGGWLSHELDGD